MAFLEDSFLSHLIELRNRLIRAVAAIIVVFLCLMPWASNIYDLLAAPMLHSLPEGTKMIATGVITPVFVPVKITLMAAFIIALPVVLYQAWAFIAPGLYAHERRFALPMVVGGTALFISGMAFCYFFVFKTVFHFIATFAPKSITALKINLICHDHVRPPSVLRSIADRGAAARQDRYRHGSAVARRHAVT